MVQEPVTAWTLTRDGNPIAFGGSLNDRPDRRAATVAEIESVVRGRLPGVRFYVVKYPALLGEHGETKVKSYRSHGKKALIVLSWIEDAQGFRVWDISWEVEHLVAGTDDFGRPWRF